MVCPTMVKHSEMTTKFATQLRSLMSLICVETTDEIPAALQRMTAFSNPQDLLKKIIQHQPENGFFRRFLPLCGCSSNNPDFDITPILSTKSHESEANFCFHRKLPMVLFDLYQKIFTHFHDFFLGFAKVQEFLKYYYDPETFRKLLEFEVCTCVHVAHKRLDFHLSGCEDHSFLPAMLVSSRLLSPIFRTPKVLDFSTVGFPESEFEVIKLSL